MPKSGDQNIITIWLREDLISLYCGVYYLWEQIRWEPIFANVCERKTIYGTNVCSSVLLQGSQKNALIDTTHETCRRSTYYFGFGFFGFVVATIRAHIQVVRIFFGCHLETLSNSLGTLALVTYEWHMNGATEFERWLTTFGLGQTGSELIKFCNIYSTCFVQDIFPWRE
jgi:hypothetical protein